MSKNVAVFVDVANIFYAAKAAGVDIDYVTLLKASTAGRDFVRAYAYTGLDPENENQRQFHAFLGRSGYKVISKDIRKYGDGRIKANLDIELVVDMMRMAQHIDIAVVVSGDGDFAPAIRAVQQQGVRVEVVSFRGNTSSDLIEVADVFTDISQLARVEKGERSGRRVASEDDLSMTAVPEKETDNGVRRRRGEGRRTDRPERGERADRVERPSTRGPRPVPVTGEVPVATGGTIIALPGERLSRAAVEDFDDDVDVEEFGEVIELDTDVEGSVPVEGAETEGETEARRRRRRRGGRGRGRGRRGEGEQTTEVAEAAAGEPREPLTIAPARGPVEVIDPTDLIEDEYLEEEVATLPQHSTFGSVWESQIGVAPAPVSAGPLDDQDGYDDEPEIPEYLLAERRQQGRNRGGSNQRPGNRGASGGRNAPSAGYRTAVDRERYGRAGAPTTGSFSSGSGGNNAGRDRGDRQPDRNRAGQGGQGGRGPARAPQSRPVSAEPRERFERADRPPVSAEPWSEVPAEVQEMLRAELARRQPAARPQSVSQASASPANAPTAGRSRRAPRAASTEAAPVAEVIEAPTPAPTETPKAAAKGAVKAPARTRTKATAAEAPAPMAETKPPPTEAAKGAGRAPARSRTKASTAAAPESEVKAPAKAATRSRTKAVTAEAPAAAAPAADAAAAPKTTRRRSTKSTTSGTGEG